MKIENDNMANDKFREFLDACFKNLFEALKEGGAFYIWHASRTQREFEEAINNAGATVRQQLIWNKNSLVLGRQDYQWKHEPCFYGWKDGATHYFVPERTNTTVIEDKINLDEMKKEEMKKLLEEIYSDKIPTTVIDEHKPSKNEDHPTMKPVKLIAKQVQNSSRIGESILDLFGGSGTTLIACEQLNRKCYMMEYDPHYADVIIDRWEKLTGEKAVKIS